ncbi:MAG: ABC transporter ATP-binding protein [Clostridia bacterium]|nr:ABC transporter ATP-binding protein [Clostridia bacterium]
MDFNYDDLKGISSLATWKKLGPFIKPYTRLLIKLGLFMLIASGVDIIMPLMAGYAVELFVEPNTLEGLWIFVLVCILGGLCMFIGTMSMAVFAIDLEMYISRDLKNALFDHLQTLGFDYYNSTPVGTILARTLSDAGKIGTVFAWSIVDMVWALGFIIGSIVVMCVINIKLALIIIAIVPIVGVITYIFQKKILAANRKVRHINSEMTRKYNEGISGAKTSKTLVIEEKNADSFRETTENMRRSSIHAVMLNAVYVPIVTLLTSVSVALVLTKGGNSVIAGAIGIGELTIFINYALVIADPVQQFARTLSRFISTQVNVERCNYLLEIEPQIKDTPEVVEKYGTAFEPKKENWEPIEGHITFDDVTFMYSDGTENVLEHFNLDVPAGTTVAIVGETGAGKSTLVNLACRFFEPTGGRILVDGVDYRERSTLWLHSNIGYVLQTPHLFSGTVKDNIRYGRLDATDEEIIAAAKLVSAHDSIMRMEKGYDSDVGEGGDQLSTGEKQLISFARAVLANPRIFVLDEATASIDTHTEQLIQNAISKLLGTRTSFLIAHRLSTIRQADIILVVKSGKIIERGTHEELMKLGGYYADLYNKQFSDESTEKVFNEVK